MILWSCLSFLWRELWTAVLFLSKESLSLFFLPLIRMAPLLQGEEHLVLILYVCQCVWERERESVREKLIKLRVKVDVYIDKHGRPYIILTRRNVCVCERERREEGAHNGLDFCLLVKKKKWWRLYYRWALFNSLLPNLDSNIKISKDFYTCMNYYPIFSSTF